MDLSSPKIAFDTRLVVLEDLLLYRRFSEAMRSLAEITSDDLDPGQPYQHGLLLSLRADCENFQGNYKKAIEQGLEAARILANYPANRRYGRVQLILSKAYYATGDLKNSEIRARDSLSSYRRAADTNGQIDALNQLAGIAYVRCNYPSTSSFLEEALALVVDNPRKTAQLTGNLGRTRIRTGRWAQAEVDLKMAIEVNAENQAEISVAMNKLSLGMLQMRRRQFTLAGRTLDDALEIISRTDLKRERIIYAEYAGELAFEKGDYFKAKAILSDGYQRGLMLAPVSALVSQTSRRLAEAELALDNIGEAMKYGQKALELSLQLGEKVEIGLSHSVIARVFLTKGDHSTAAEHMRNAVEILTETGDSYELGRTLLVQADILMASNVIDYDKARASLDQARRLFRRLKSEYWMSEADMKSGIFACQCGELSRGFKKLNRAERTFRHLRENVRVRAVSKFLRTLSDQAVALSTSDKNEFKAFGHLVTPDEISDFHADDMSDVLSVLLQRVDGRRAVAYVPAANHVAFYCSADMNEVQVRCFREGFDKLLGQEISKSKPTLILDCRRDPFINGLFSDVPEVISSMIVVPFKTSEGYSGYLYVDRLSSDNGLSPFDQLQLNFVVGFADLVAFKWTEIVKNQLLEDNRRLKKQLQAEAAFPNIITQNAQMLSMLAQVRQVIDSNISIAIEGETGSGKDLLAKAIHYNSNRSEKRFISVNCAALPESLLESELFGYKRGSFTGADRDKAGLFEEADGGTFFLDEIADMPLSVQAKVLRILEEKEVVRLGESVPRKVDVRLISATNKNLKELMDSNQFRQDLYYRLSAMTFKLPPLRDRLEDIPLLVDHFLTDTQKKITPQLLHRLMDYDWPGNVRELDNEVKKMVLLSGDASDLTLEIASERFKDAAQTVRQLGAYRQPDEEPVFGEQYSLYDYLAERERRFIVKALKLKMGVKKHAAASLNIPESTLRLKIKQYGIDPKSLN